MKKNKLTGPTYLTIARMVLSVLFMFFVLAPETWAKIVALVLFIAGAISDFQRDRQTEQTTTELIS